MFEGVSLHAIGGEQLLLCRVRYEPGATVPRHSHADTEQVMLMLEGELEMTVGDETRTLRAGDTVVVNRGVEHELHSESGCAFIEALSPVPLDHVGDREADLVLGPDGGRLHVER
jgi:quercetin dioxygenase-like cupin family protein